MDCREWEEQLEDLLRGSLAAARRAEADAHVTGCARCSELLAVVQRNQALLSDREQTDLTTAILERTSGRTCARARELLPNLTGGTLGSLDASLIGQHLERCVDCRTLASTLTWLVPLLGRMAEREPDPGFAADVIRATSSLRRAEMERRRTAWGRGHWGRLAGASAHRMGQAEARLAAWWRRQLVRPAFALEAAYVGTLLVIALCGTPISPLRQAPARALAVVQASPAGLATAVRDLFAVLPQGLSGRVNELASEAWEHTGAPFEQEVRAAREALQRRGRQAAPAVAQARLDGRAFAGAVLRGDFVVAGKHLEALGADLQLGWREWRRHTSADAPSPG